MQSKENLEIAKQHTGHRLQVCVRFRPYERNDAERFAKYRILKKDTQDYVMFKDDAPKKRGKNDN